MDEVVPAAPPCWVFLDLAWLGSTPHRVVIRLSPNTPMGRRFVLLCTGQRGPCYRSTRLVWVYNKGQPGEWVLGGDYENNDGTGGTALLPHLDKGEYQQSDKAGAVFGVNNCDDDDDWNARFSINTRDEQDGCGPSYCVFGDVVECFEGLVAAVQHTRIKKVTVVECGVVLWA